MYRSLLGTDRVSHLNDNPTYVQLCHLFNLPTLHDRRIVNDCLFLYKHFNNRYNLADANPFSLHVPQRRTRSAAKKRIVLKKKIQNSIYGERHYEVFL